MWSDFSTLSALSQPLTHRAQALLLVWLPVLPLSAHLFSTPAREVLWCAYARALSELFSSV